MRDLVARDKAGRQRFAGAVGEAIRAGHEVGLSVSQIAAGLCGGVDDPGPVSDKTLYAVAEGRRPLWAHKVVALVEVTGCVAPLRVLAESCGYVLTRVPGSDAVGEMDVLRAVREHGEAMGAIAGAVERAAAGRGVSVGEWERVERELGESLEATAALREAVRERMGRRK